MVVDTEFDDPGQKNGDPTGNGTCKALQHGLFHRARRHGITGARDQSARDCLEE